MITLDRKNDFVVESSGGGELRIWKSEMITGGVT